MRRVSFEKSAFEDFQSWESEDKGIYDKILSLLKDILRSPFSGIGKPEPLKHELKGYWSRRINHEHRLVYKVTETEIIVVACKYHYVSAKSYPPLIFSGSRLNGNNEIKSSCVLAYGNRE